MSSNPPAGGSSSEPSNSLKFTSPNDALLAKQPFHEERLLQAFILDYLTKREYHRSAEIFASETDCERQPPTASPGGGILILDFWKLFWDVFQAHAKRKDQRQMCTPGAKAFVDAIRQRTRMTQPLTPANAVVHHSKGFMPTPSSSGSPSRHPPGTSQGQPRQASVSGEFSHQKMGFRPAAPSVNEMGYPENQPPPNGQRPHVNGHINGIAGSNMPPTANGMPPPGPLPPQHERPGNFPHQEPPRPYGPPHMMMPPQGRPGMHQPGPPMQLPLVPPPGSQPGRPNHPRINLNNPLHQSTMRAVMANEFPNQNFEDLDPANKNRASQMFWQGIHMAQSGMSNGARPVFPGDVARQHQPIPPQAYHPHPSHAGIGPAQRVGPQAGLPPMSGPQMGPPRPVPTQNYPTQQSHMNMSQVPGSSGQFSQPGVLPPPHPTLAPPKLAQDQSQSAPTGPPPLMPSAGAAISQAQPGFSNADGPSPAAPAAKAKGSKKRTSSQMEDVDKQATKKAKNSRSAKQDSTPRGARTPKPGDQPGTQDSPSSRSLPTPGTGPPVSHASPWDAASSKSVASTPVQVHATTTQMLPPGNMHSKDDMMNTNRLPNGPSHMSTEEDKHSGNDGKPEPVADPSATSDALTASAHPSLAGTAPSAPAMSATTSADYLPSAPATNPSLDPPLEDFEEFIKNGSLFEELMQTFPSSDGNTDLLNSLNMNFDPTYQSLFNGLDMTPYLGDGGGSEGVTGTGPSMPPPPAAVGTATATNSRQGEFFRADH